ncbi:MAG: glycosyltransferase family 39 protein [Saprospiraceae bacterium]|nr:glycosyltransferase family 39 protein [Saprospiraceae bacterium]
MNFNKAHITRWLFDVRVWILVLFLIRLENIDLPPLDEHAWRQTITLGVARNYEEVSPAFFEPRTVICDSRQGIIAQEFPFFNYCITILWKIFGTYDWVFRVFNLLVASFGLYFFSSLAKRFIGTPGNVFATIIFGVSVAFMYARKAMPDVFAVSLVIIGVEFGWRYMQSGKSKELALFLLFSGLGMLSKMPATLTMALLLPLVFRKDTLPRTKTLLITAAGIAAAAMVTWYFVWVPWAEKTKGFPLFYPTSFSDGWKQLVEMKNDTISRFYPIALTSRVSFLFFLAGLVWMFRTKHKTLIWTFTASTVLLVLYMLKSGGTFAGHVYYIMPFVPMMSLLAGYGISELVKNQWLQLACIALITVEANVEHKADFFIPWQEEKFLKLERIVDQHIPKDARILVNNREGSPIMMYFAHRRGWTVTDRMKDSSWVAGESTVGLHYMVIERSRWKGDSLPWPQLYQDNEFQIYKTKKD